MGEDIHPLAGSVTGLMAAGEDIHLLEVLAQVVEEGIRLLVEEDIHLLVGLGTRKGEEGDIH